MEFNINNIIAKTAESVLGEEYSASCELYAVRFRFLYTLMLEEADRSGQDVQKLSEQIEAFELSQRSMTLFGLDDFRSLTPSAALEVFSTVSFGLAVEHLKGSDHTMVANYMKEAFAAFVSDESLVSDALREQHSVLISESLLDLAYAGGDSELMSLRMKTQLYDM